MNASDGIRSILRRQYFFDMAPKLCSSLGETPGERVHLHANGTTRSGHRTRFASKGIDHDGQTLTFLSPTGEDQGE